MTPPESARSADSREVVADREHVTIPRERRPDEPDRYHVADPLDHLQTFADLSKARLYADVYAVVGGFREEKTGERGVPPAVAAARETVLMAYLTSQPTMSLIYAARSFRRARGGGPPGREQRTGPGAAEQRESTDDE